MVNNKIFKYDKYDKPMPFSNEDKEDIIYWESLSKEVVDDALKELYAKGISSVHGDKKGIYEISPEGERTYIKIKE